MSLSREQIKMRIASGGEKNEPNSPLLPPIAFLNNFFLGVLSSNCSKSFAAERDVGG